MREAQQKKKKWLGASEHLWPLFRNKSHHERVHADSVSVTALTESGQLHALVLFSQGLRRWNSAIRGWAFFSLSGVTAGFQVMRLN